MTVEALRRYAGVPGILIGGAAAGGLANLAGIPLAWMVAPLVVSAIATLTLKLPRLPVRARYVGQMVVGAAVGLYLTPEAMSRIAEFAVPIVLGAIIVTFGACAIALFQIRIAGRRVEVMHLADAVIEDAEKLYVDAAGLDLIGRMHGRGWYARTTDLFRMDRLAAETELKVTPGDPVEGAAVDSKLDR